MRYLDSGVDIKKGSCIIKENTIYIKNCGSFARTDFLEFRDGRL